MKKILLIATGGTIAAKPTDDGMVPMIAPEELLQSVPGISALCETETVRPINLDSTDMSPVHRLTLAQCVEQNYDALVIESFGVGGIPSYGNDRFMDAIRDWMHDGKTVVMTTQVPHEGSDMTICHVGHRVKSQYDMIEAYTMTLEAVVTKLMWILAITRDAAEIRRLFYRSVAHDLLQIE